MFYLTSSSIAMDLKECPINLNFIDFDIDKRYSCSNNYALKIDFHNDIKYSIKCINKLISLHNNNISFATPYKDFNLTYIISNYNDEIIDALKAIFIDNIMDKYNIQRCKHLDRKVGCTVKNISCKLFVCKYLKNNEKFNLSPNDIILFQCFFTKKQQLVLKYNFFKTKEEIITKLLEKNSLPYFIYYLTNSYRIE